jgi:CheY-like chemotaxis protein
MMSNLNTALPKGKETVLLIDDDDMVADVGEQILNNSGYDVVVADSGKQAIKVYKENRDRIDIVILDMIMPEMSGGETYDRLKMINPKVKVLLSSGYSIDGQASKILKQGCNGFIQKPFNMSELLEKIGQILTSE